MSTKTNSAAEAAALLSDNPKVEQQVGYEIRRSSLVSHLLSLRVSRGVTQEQIAESMRCNPSKISRIESGNDLGLKWLDIVGYAEALNLDMCLLFEDPSLPAADRIKEYVFRIHSDLEHLAALAKQAGEDDEIAKKIHQFYGEVLLNFVIRYKDNFEKLRAVVKVPFRQADKREKADAEPKAGCELREAQPA